MAEREVAAPAPGAVRGVLGRANARTLAIVGGVALLLIAIGPYVLPTYMVNSLIREIGRAHV